MVVNVNPSTADFDETQQGELDILVVFGPVVCPLCIGDEGTC